MASGWQVNWGSPAGLLKTRLTYRPSSLYRCWSELASQTPTDSHREAAAALVRFSATLRPPYPIGVKGQVSI
ncbi:hypothetical protein FA13DRAFT_1742936 [Coprinellus micaceus]|uniref:Uncharacterized protein n=1 Tax=Coprinellus micaceus TaxID=71717 RepID=A0A4Y7SFQ1_COPMI|nr:hypothetical protein FA13DRAFT_1742936 [Coprinellus micaceus]